MHMGWHHSYNKVLMMLSELSYKPQREVLSNDFKLHYDQKAKQ